MKFKLKAMYFKLYAVCAKHRMPYAGHIAFLFFVVLTELGHEQTLAFVNNNINKIYEYGGTRDYHFNAY